MDKIVYSVVVIGAGGTGGYFLKEASRFLCNHMKYITRLCIFDGDRVEEKNLSRQCFQQEDIGLMKSEVMAEVLNDAFHITWESYGFLNELSQLSHLQYKSYSNLIHIPIIIGCVDNHECRLLLEKYFETQENCIYLDSANEFRYGEAIFAYKMNGQVISPVRSFYFPELKQVVYKKRSEMSCTELNNVAPQHIVTNMLAGFTLLSEFTSLMDGNCHPGMVCFDSLNFSLNFVPYKNREGE